jgi:hypothetical protein
MFLDNERDKESIVKAFAVASVVRGKKTGKAVKMVT